MVNLKDFLALDIQNVFFNEKEFAEVALINEVPVVVNIDDYQLQKQNLQKGEGLTEDELLFHVKKTDILIFLDKFFIDQTLKFNGKSYKVTSITESIGVYTVTLVGIRSGGRR